MHPDAIICASIYSRLPPRRQGVSESNSDMKIKWLNYEFTVLEHGDQWNEVGGIYIFCGVNPQNQWVAKYIGQADSFRTRIPQHEQWSPAKRLGATHVHAMVVEAAARRLLVERELIQRCQPPLNVHHK